MRLVTDATYPHNQPKTLAQRVADDEIDEVFLFGASAGLAGWEAAMAGPTPYFVNGDPLNIPTAPRNFVVMGFSYERDVDCMLENFLHRSECVMNRVYPSPDWWLPTFPAQNNWENFRMIDIEGTGASAVGTCHLRLTANLITIGLILALYGVPVTIGCIIGQTCRARQQNDW